MFEPHDIKGLRAREPVGVALTIGRKDSSRGFPIEKDRFHLVYPYESDGRREHHPGFAFFNNADKTKRRVIKGNLVHGARAECFEHHLKAQVLNKKAHPDRRPCCVGDGSKAVRWTGDGPDEFMDIKCPNERCEYRVCTPPQCKPWMRFLFRPRWSTDDLPSALCKFTSGSWNTVANFLGFFEHIEEMAKQLRIGDFSLYGLPFTLTLVERTQASKQRKFPTVSISPDMDPIAWLQQQRLAMESIGAAPMEALTDESQRDPSVVADDAGIIDVPRGKT